MKSKIEDKELGRLIKSIKPETPGIDFTSRVMDRVYKEQPSLEHVKQDPILGHSFWIILALFAILTITMILFSGNSLAWEKAPSLIPEVNADAVLKGYRSFFNKIEALPTTIAGILISTSLLVFLDKILGSRVTVVVNQ